MVKCPKCNSEWSDDTKFCTNCGAEIFETIFCTNCGKQTSTEFDVCQNCGAPTNANGNSEQALTAPNGEKTPIPKNVIMYAGIGAAVLIVIILLISLIASAGSKLTDPVLYIKDSEIYLNKFKKNSEPIQLTSELLDYSYLSEYTLAGGLNAISNLVKISEDGKYIFYIDEIEDSDDGYNLFYKKTSKLDDEPVKIDSEVYSFVVNDDATLVTYRNYDDELYQYNMKKDTKDKLESDVAECEISDDGLSYVVLDEDDRLYVKYKKDDAEKISSDVTTINKVSEDYKTIYFTKD